ncbi:MAG TPA: GNAT family N-acetyltransferase [Candidatus Limnocylindrales bacterium]|jgi:aminoglycoside 2'-N-acetyltransferase I|nr:GNAT family N-acetyltransferase [Candidatus Limnocylindrales bacterium]
MTPDASKAAVSVRTLSTFQLTETEQLRIRALLDAAFDDPKEPDEAFTDDDWLHAVGGTHVVAEMDGAIVGHAAVVERELHVAGRAVRAGYVEAVAVAPERHGLGIGTAVMEAVDAIIRGQFELGALGTGAHHFYERLGWRSWTGPGSVRAPDGDRPTPDDDGFILWLPTRRTPPSVTGSEPLSCDWRPGDVW